MVTNQLLLSPYSSCGVCHHRPANFVPGASNLQSTSAEDVKELPTVQRNTRGSTGICIAMNARRTKFLLTTELEGMATWTIEMIIQRLRGTTEVV